MTPQPFIVADGDTAPFEVLGVRITILAANEATHGYEITLQEGDEGAGPPPHAHDWDESFYVLRGEVDVEYAGERRTLRPGALVHIPRGTVHGYRFRAGGGGMLEISGQGGGATQMFQNVGRAFPSADGDLPTMLALLAENGVRVAM